MHSPDLRPRLAEMIRHPRVFVSLLALALIVIPLGILSHDLDGDDPGVQARLIASKPGVHTYSSLTSDADFARGTVAGLRSSNGTLGMVSAASKRVRAGYTFEAGAWTSAWVAPGQTFTELIPSWNAGTPSGAWIQVLVQVRSTAGTSSGFKDLGSWSTRDGVFKRSSAGRQADAVAEVSTDTLRARPGVTLSGYRFLVRLMRLPGRTGPALRSIGAVVSRLPVGTPVTSGRLKRTAITLPVPAYSQMTHRGQNPEYGGGGEAWCSPTSLAMVLGYYKRLPAPAEYAWTRYKQGWVNQVARLTYDNGYRGTGNWPFNTAVAADRVGDAFVTRLPNLFTAERFIRAGIPVVLSVRFSRGQLTGAPISSTPGHLLVLVGFTSTGRPIVNDPAAPSDATVRRSYDRGQFERAWLTGSGGMAYVVRDAAHPLPWRPAGPRAW